MWFQWVWLIIYYFITPFHTWRSFACSLALYFIIEFGLYPWPSVASLSLSKMKHLRLFSCFLSAQMGTVDYAEGFCPPAVDYYGMVCFVQEFFICSIFIFIVSIRTRVCIYSFICILGGAVAFFFFLLPSHLELLSQAFCKVVSCCASHLGLINFVTEIDSTWLILHSCCFVSATFKCFCAPTKGRSFLAEISFD